MRTVHISPSASNEWSETLIYIKRLSPQGAVSSQQLLDEAINEIAMDPSKCSRFDSPSIQAKYNILRKNFGKRSQFCILFESFDNHIQIYWIGRGVRDLPHHLAADLDDPPPSDPTK